MSIYTKTGDKGSTALVGGERVSKSDPQVDTYGTVDELNAMISFANKAVTDIHHQQALQAIQHQLFYMGAELATPQDVELKSNQRYISNDDISELEVLIDHCMNELPTVSSFVLPGESDAASRLHVARTIARRAERRVIELAQHNAIRQELLQYLNRLSDCLYALARYEDHLAQQKQMVTEVMRRYQKAITDDSTPQVTSENNKMEILETLSIQILQQATSAARRLQIPVVVALVDRHGNPILTYRMPDALLISSELAQKKAFTAVALKQPTHQLQAAVQPGAKLFQLETSSGGKIVTFGGGLPMYQDGRIVAGIGISGGTVEQDIEIAEAAINGI